MGNDASFLKKVSLGEISQDVANKIWSKYGGRTTTDLNQKQFSAFYKDFAVTHNLDSSLEAQDALFQKLDVDGDGSISFAEMTRRFSPGDGSDPKKEDGTSEFIILVKRATNVPPNEITHSDPYVIVQIGKDTQKNKSD